MGAASSLLASNQRTHYDHWRRFFLFICGSIYEQLCSSDIFCKLFSLFTCENIFDQLGFPVLISSQLINCFFLTVCFRGYPIWFAKFTLGLYWRSFYDHQ